MIRRQNPLYRFSRSDSARSSRCHKSDTISSMRIPSLSIQDRNKAGILTALPKKLVSAGMRKTATPQKRGVAVVS